MEATEIHQQVEEGVRLPIKTVKISEKTHAELTKLGVMSETYDDLIARLVDHFKKCNLKD
jgi:hypothetical protein